MERVTKIPTVFDTADQQVGEVYARALLGLGQKTGQTENLLAELNAFADAAASFPRLGQILSAPRVSNSDKARIIEKALSGRCSQEFRNFVHVITRRGRFSSLPAVRQSASEIYDEFAGQARALVTTAAPINDETKQRIAAGLGKLLDKKVLVETGIDQSIIGGMVVRIGDTVYDASVVTQLRRMQSKAIKRVADSIRVSVDRFASDA